MRLNDKPHEVIASHDNAAEFALLYGKAMEFICPSCGLKPVLTAVQKEAKHAIVLFLNCDHCAKNARRFLGIEEEGGLL